MKRILSSQRQYNMRATAIFLLVAVLVAGVVGCEPAATPQYELTITNTTGGQVTIPGEGTFTYDEGMVVNLVAEAEEGRRFVEWTGDIEAIADPTASQTTITIESDYSLAASFVAVYNLTISSTEGGSVTAPGEGIFTCDKGTVLGLAAIPNPGYRFLNWTGDVGTIADATSAETTITMNENHSISAIFKAAYATSDTLVEGLSRPAIHTTDRQGGVYFTEFDPLLNKCRINRFDPVTSETVQLIEHQDAEVRLLSLDGQGDLYYVLRRYVEPPVAQICRLSPGEAESQILFSTEELQQWLLALTVDWSGNVYFALQSGAQSQGLPGSELCRIPAGTTAIETLLVLEDSLQIGNFSMAYDPNSLYFTSTLQEVDRIYRFNSESEALDILLERTTEDFGMIPYLATRADGELYYLYRRRSDQADPVQFGYLEIGRFTLEALETCQPPELLLADQLDQAVWVWILSTHSFFTVSNTGDVFFDVILYEEDPVEQAPVGIFWFAPLTGTYLALAEGTIEEVHCFTFVLDDEGNVYYAARTPGTIVRIDR